MKTIHVIYLPGLSPQKFLDRRKVADYIRNFDQGVFAFLTDDQVFSKWEELGCSYIVEQR